MRIPTSKVWRAFPELDPFPDDQCGNFVRTANRGALRRCAQFLLIFVALVATLAAGWAAAYGVAALTTDSSAPWMQTQERRINTFTLVMIPTVFACGGAGLLVRDWQLRRRVRAVLRDRGACPACRYVLLGLPISTDHRVSCPECGLAVTVDPAMGELSLDERGYARFAVGNRPLPRPSFWTQKRKRIRKRALITLAVLLFGVVPAIVGSYELWLRRQAAAAKRDRIGVEGLREIALSLGLPVGDASRSVHLEIDRVRAALNKAEDTVPNDYIDYGLIYVPYSPGTSYGVDRAKYDEDRARAVAAMQRAKNAGVFVMMDALRDMEAGFVPPDTVQPDGPPFGVSLPAVGSMRQLARVCAARMEAAHQADNTDEFARALETMLALERHSAFQPFVVNAMVAEAINAVAFDRIRAHLGPDAKPTPEWLDAVEAAIARQSRRPPPDFLWKCEEAWTLDSVAWCFSEPSRVRFGRFTPRLRTELGALGFSGAFMPGRLGAYAENRAEVARLFAADAPLAKSPRHLRPPPSGAAPSDLFLLNYLQPRGLHALRARDDGDARRAALAIMLALERFRLATGDYPQKLDELVPSILPEVPNDVFSGKPMAYKRVDPTKDPGGRSYLLYSVGADGADDGGVQQPLEGWYVSPSTLVPGVDFVYNPAPPKKP
ncbi:MAG TPA: hypothetical protein VD971_01060 [Phycisphaerales bacterium]|nr:hypothetical protein [Phycisphaerales bacterium]